MNMVTRQRRGAGWIPLWLLIGAALSGGSGLAFAADAPRDISPARQGKKVLVLHSYHYGMRWAASIIRGIEAVFESPEGRWHVLQHEFMDTKRISSPEYFEELARLFAMKFRADEFDVIIASDDDAFSFLLQYRDRLFDATPVVFCGVNYFQPGMLEGPSGITGVVESYDLVGTLDAALALHPKTHLVFVVNDQTSTGVANNKRVEEIIPAYSDRVSFRFAGPSSMAELLEDIRGLPEDSLILLMSFNRDRLGQVFRYRDSARLVCSSSPLPVYSVWAFYLGDGIVGGMLTSGEIHGRAAAGMALRILGGERAEDIPVILQCPNQYMFDDDQLRRFGLSASQLSAGSVVINQPEIFYLMSKRTMWFFLAGAGLLGMLAVVYGININKRLQAQHALQSANEQMRREMADRLQAQQERERLATAIAQMADGVVIADVQQGIITYVNPALEQMTGYSAAELLGQSVRIFGRPEQIHQVREVMEVMRRGESWRGRMRTRRKDGRLRDEDVVISPVREATGRVSHYLAIRRDVTESVALQNQVMETQKIETVGEIAGGIAHDFNNMLTVILSSAQFLAEAVGADPKLAKDANEIVRTAKRASVLTRELLTFRRKHPLELKPRNINEVVRRMESMLHHIAGERVRLVLNLAREPCVAQIDRARIEQALANLVMNARDAIEGKGEVTVSTSLTTLGSESAADFIEPPEPTPGRYVRIAVRDTGCGIPEAIRGRIFEPLFTTKPEGEGTGLGLSVVSGIIKQHNGRLALETQLDKGSVFKLYIPAVYAPPADLAATGLVPTIPGGKETVLLVEDERSVREVAGRIMAHLGYKVLTADCAESALQLVEKTQETIHLLFTDIVMPGMDGVSLARELLKQKPGLRVVFASGYSQERLGKDPELASIPLLKKPFEAGELARLIRSVLDGPDSQSGATA